MNVAQQLELQSTRTLRLVRANFAMLFILFAGLILVIWQALGLGDGLT